MNMIMLTGRLVKDPEVRYIPDTQRAVASFCIAVDRPTKGDEKKADFPLITVFGKQAEVCERYLKKGRKVAVDGRLQTRKYEKNGETVYASEVVAKHVEFMDYPKKAEEEHSETPEGFEDDDALRDPF